MASMDRQARSARLRGFAAGFFALALSGCAALDEIGEETARLRPDCPAERAIYAIEGSAAELRIVKPPFPASAASDLAIRVQAGEDVLWFSILESNGYGARYLGYISDPTAPDAADPHDAEGESGGREFGLFDADMNAILNTPQAGDPAPAFLYAPGVGQRFWYDRAGRQPIPNGMWRRVTCAPR